jgi:hypothetical protein
MYLHSGWIFNTLLEFILHFVKLADFGLRYGKMIHSVKEKVYGISILLEKNAVECIIIKIMCVKNVQMNHAYMFISGFGIYQ